MNKGKRRRLPGRDEVIVVVVRSSQWSKVVTSLDGGQERGLLEEKKKN